MRELVRVVPPARSLVGWLARWLAVGVLVAGVWDWLTPLVGSWSDVSYEQVLSGDVTLAGLEVLVGLAAALVGLVRPGRGSAARFGAAVAGSAVASCVAWGAGRLIGAPPLTMNVVLVLAPLVLALVTVLWVLIAVIVIRDPFAD
jgi:hypothetical protein